MKITGNKSISSAIKIFLSCLFAVCIFIMIILPITLKSMGMPIFENSRILMTEIIFLYIAAIPALMMIVEFWKIFNDFSKDNVFSRKNEKRLKRTSIYCLLIGIIFIINIFAYFGQNNFAENNYFSMLYIISITLLTLIFLILSIGLIILKNIYKVAIDNKEENDLTI